jgi:calcineurin-like phosphoesterase family protein
MKWLLTDPHFNHENLVLRGNRPKGYETLIWDSWTSLVGQGDTVYCLGDVCFKKQGESHEMYVMPMPGYKILIAGNHDRQKPQWYLDHGWNEFHPTTLRVQHGPVRVLLSHKPQQDDGSFDVNVHGHFHNDVHRAQEPDMVAIRSPKHRLLALECVNYQLVPFGDFVDGKVVQEGLPV